MKPIPEPVEHRITVTIACPDVSTAETDIGRLLAAFHDSHPEVGAVTGANPDAGTIDVTFALDAADWQQAVDLGRPVFVESYEASGLPPSDVVRVEVEPVPIEELDEPGSREPALT